MKVEGSTIVITAKQEVLNIHIVMTMGKLKISTFPSFSSTIIEIDMILIYKSGSRSRRNKDTGL